MKELDLIRTGSAGYLGLAHCCVTVFWSIRITLLGSAIMAEGKNLTLCLLGCGE